ncbi:ABC transporter substrate-binding protein [Snodgrassella communis]|jgi:thiamine transport system substrate-binding protein|uniref:thiamine ABC transporter substrate-binding protein n=1 Tax=Snodgrassella communis TaxID=2946699 RepID=UPI000C1F3BB4|nr:thiamine ABC transporter substrate-binding protein [Snodgrassella communis]PIT19991.1 ABC transporter substrate-binding protein [Snodgrassella communis]PIT24759.1 ABC transporter substrate-binding protein [Snodgrassella communis]
MKVGKWLIGILCMLMAVLAQAQPEVRLAVHDSFSLPKNILAQFEQDNQVKLTVIKLGSGNEMLNKLILTRAKPIADAVYGLDYSNISRAQRFELLAADQPRTRKVVVDLPQALEVDYGFIVINYDKAWFQKHKKPLPRSLEELASPAYKDLLVMPSPATSTVGLGFLLANITILDEPYTWQWWAKMRQNGVKITKSWSEAYYTDFTLNGGSRPMVVGYATSPVAEVYYGKGKYQTPPTGYLSFKGAVFRQVEGAAVLNKARQPVLAARLVQYLQSDQVQSAIPTSMWVYPAVKGVVQPPVYSHASIPPIAYQPGWIELVRNQEKWVKQWVKVVQR